MPIQGFETPSLVRAQIVALERELTQLWTESHGEAVRAQLGIFTAELQRMQEEGIEDVPDPNANPAHGTRDPYGTWVGRV
jgi:hypothetical protein